MKLDKGLQTEPGFALTPQWFRKLPRNLMTFATLHHSGDTWANERVLVPQGEVRIDGRSHTDGRFVYTIDGPSGTYALPVAKSFTGEYCTASGCQTVTQKAGSRWSVTIVRGGMLIGQRE